MTNTVTISNFESKKVEILNAVSINGLFGVINHPRTWNVSLCIFDFESENVIDMVTSYIFNEYEKQVTNF